MRKSRSPLDVFEWSEWRASADDLTIGIEEEFMLLDPRDWSLAFQADEVIIDLPPDLRERVTLETHAAVMEVTTGIHERVADAATELADLRGRLASLLAEHGLRAAVAGTHPRAVAEDTVVSTHPRYRDIGESMRVLARREPTLATHVHVGVPTPAAAIRLLNRLRAHLPLLLALSANSPFWKGTDTGFASTRTTLFDAFPRSGVPRTFAGYWDWIETVDLLLRSNAIADPSFLWWDVRLQPRLGTVEVRVMDGQTAVDDVAALAALIQSLASLELERPYRTADNVEVIEENRFLAARDGMDAELIEFGSGERVAATAHLERILGACAAHAERLGCEHELAGARRLGGCSGAARQRAAARAGDLRDVTAALACAYASEVAIPC
jgi:carboxylate-amine ligase